MTPLRQRMREDMPVRNLPQVSHGPTLPRPAAGSGGHSRMICRGSARTPRTPRRVGQGLATGLILSGQTIGADEALTIGMVDKVVAHEQLDAPIREIIAAGRAAVREPKPVPDSPRLIATFFDRHGVAELLGGQATRPADPTLAKSVTRIGTKAPVALRRSAELIDRAAELPIEQGLALELSHLREIFATKDAYEGLSSLGRKAPVFGGDRLEPS